MDPWEKLIIKAEMRTSELGPFVIILPLLTLVPLYQNKQNKAPGTNEEPTQCPNYNKSN